MGVRTTAQKVAEILPDVDATRSMVPFIRSASALVDWLVTQDTTAQLGSELPTEIETWLAAHFYSHADQLYRAKAQGRSNGQFQGNTNMVLSSTTYGQTAMVLDVTGRLGERSKDAEIGLRRVAGFVNLNDDCSDVDFEPECL